MPEGSESELLDRFLQTSLVLIPAHNEAPCVGETVRRFLKVGFPRIRVVANGCTDDTAQIARAAGAEVISIPGKGYGRACLAGAMNLPAEVEWLVYANADGSDDLEAVGRFAASSNTADFILGARMIEPEKAGFSPAQRFGNWLAPLLIRWIWRYRYHDLGPQRALRRSAYERLHLKDLTYGWTLEMQVRAVECRLRIEEIPVRSFPRTSGVSKISGTWSGTWAAGWTILTKIAQLAGQKMFRTSPDHGPTPPPR